MAQRRPARRARPGVPAPSRAPGGSAAARRGRERASRGDVAPELDGGLDAVRAVVAAGAVAAVGHTDATYEVARASIDAGARLGTHLFNGMRPVHHREPGPGSTLTMDAAFRRAATDVGLPLEVAARLTSATSARVLGLGDVGAIEPGRRADLVVLDEELDVVAVMARGVWVDGPPQWSSQ